MRILPIRMLLAAARKDSARPLPEGFFRSVRKPSPNAGPDMGTSAIVVPIHPNDLTTMDENVLAAMARWPNVPDVYGWLSLTELGQWRLHPQGDALKAAEAGNGIQEPPCAGAAAPSAHATGAYGSGEAITSPPILQFINRNYSHDAHGQWYFQNGPQKVYVRLDAAPYVLHTSASPEIGLKLRTHNGLDVASIASWWLDDAGRLFAMTDQGPGLVAGRDLSAVLAALKTTQGAPLLDALDGMEALNGLNELDELNRLDDARSGTHVDGVVHVVADSGAVPLSLCRADDIPARLGFVPLPRPQSKNDVAGL